MLATEFSQRLRHDVDVVDKAGGVKWSTHVLDSVAAVSAMACDTLLGLLSEQNTDTLVTREEMAVLTAIFAKHPVTVTQEDLINPSKLSDERGQDPRGFLGDFCANWLRFSKKVPSKSLIA
jgi:hypothetical protein